MDSSSTPTTEASSRVYHPNSSFDDISIPSFATDEFFDTISFDTDSLVSNASFASSETSIASYKTEKSINSRKSRYTRHKYAGFDHTRPPLGRQSGVGKSSLINCVFGINNAVGQLSYQVNLN